MYLGGKFRAAKHILPIILAGRKPGQWFVEPFLGGCNVLPNVENPRLASDIQSDLVQLYRQIADGWIPPAVVTEEFYKQVKSSPQWFPACVVAFVSVACSFGGDRRGGYARNRKGDDTSGLAGGSSRSLLKIAPKIQGVRWASESYHRLSIPDQSIIYRDPPYTGTTGYGSAFDHAAFWQWAELKTKEGHRVFVSEYKAPAGWDCVWQKEVTNSVRKKEGSTKPVEKLFVFAGIK